MYFIELRYTNGKTVRLPEPYFYGSRLTRLFWKNIAPIHITPQALYQNNERKIYHVKEF